MRLGALLTDSVVLLALLCAASVVRAEVQPLPLVPGVETSDVYRVFVDGQEVPVGVEQPAERPVESAAFLFNGPADVRIVVNRAFDACHVRPLRFGLTERATIARRAGSREIRFSLDRPCDLLIDIGDLPHLALISSPPDESLPNRNDPNVIYFGPGEHDAGRIRLKSNQTVYLAAGAKVYGAIEATCVENVRVTGRGHLYGTRHTDWQKRTYGIIFDRCRNVTVEKIGIRDCYWWTTEFLLCDGVDIRDINIISFNRNNGGLMIDGCSRLTATDCLLMTMDDCICPHALNAAGNGEAISEEMLIQDMVLYNYATGNGIRIGASFETSEVRDWTFRNIDVVERRKGGAAIYSDHSDWAVVRNLVFENVMDENEHGNAVEMFIKKTGYSCQTGYRDERGAFDGLAFINLRSLGGGVALRGAGPEHSFRNVLFAGCQVGDDPVDSREDIEINRFVDVRFSADAAAAPPQSEPPVPRAASGPARSPKELTIDDGGPGFRAFGFEETSLPGKAYGDRAQVGHVPDAFGKYAAAIYEPKIEGRYDVYVYCSDVQGVDDAAPWIIKHAKGYARAYVDQNATRGWHKLGSFRFDGASYVRLVFPNYFRPTDRPVVADAVRFVRAG